MHIATVLGARPQFIKAAPLSRELQRRGWQESIIHTGQHYDANMSDAFFEELDIPEAHVNLRIGSGSHGEQTGRMLEAIEKVLLGLKPSGLVVYGDTNSTLAGALAAAKLHIPVFHVEAGLRAWNRMLPEEHNRVLTDHCSDLLFCPNTRAKSQLAAEGITRGVVVSGDIMFDAMEMVKPFLESIDLAKRFGVVKGEYILSTIHRNTNTDDSERLRAILAAFGRVESVVVFPMHPRTSARLREFGISLPENFLKLPPVGYADMLALVQSARLVATDSGGVQKEAYWAQVPCLTLRSETEWEETVLAGWNALVCDPECFPEKVREVRRPEEHPDLFGDGRAAVRIVDAVAAFSGR